MSIDYTRDLMNPSQRAGSLQFKAASMSGGGKAMVGGFVTQTGNSNIQQGGGKKNNQSGGGYVGVAFLPQRSIGGMMGRLSYGPECTPVFKGELYPGDAFVPKSDPHNFFIGGRKKKSVKKDDCDCEEKYENMNKLQELFQMKGGGAAAPGLITQFSAISQVSPLFVKMSMSNIIAIIVLIFAHSYALQYGSKKSVKSKMMKGGGTLGEIALFGQILQPFGMSNLVAIASLLLLHYFAVRNKRLKIMSGGGNMSHAFDSSVIQQELKMKEYLGGHKIYKELEEIFLDPSSQIGGAKKSKLREAIEPLEKDQYIANGIMRMLKGLFSNFYDTKYKSKYKSKSPNQKIPKKSSNKTYLFFKKIFNTIIPVSVAIYIKKKKIKTKVKSKKVKK
jgi:hypothetical protein